MRAFTATLLLALVVPWAASAQSTESTGEMATQQVRDTGPDGVPNRVRESDHDAVVGKVADLPPYDASGRRDPFRPFFRDIRPDEAPPMTPLQRFETGQLTVSATVWDIMPPHALLEDSTGMGYIVTLGTLIGHHGGVVTAIGPARVIVEERVVDFYGKEQLNRIVMETPKEEGPSQPIRERK